MMMTGAQIIIECLIEQDVDTIFGYPGGTILNLYDAVYQNSDRISHYLTSHEQGAAHAADGYARATGKPGVCFATSGPGATNLVTGIATAYMDSIPMVAITCNVQSQLLGRDSFQEVDITGITMPITKHNYIVSKVEDLADTVREAFYIAGTGRRGPVLIDIPKDLTAMECEYTYKKPKEIIPRMSATENDLRLAAEMIAASAKPFIISGGGVIGIPGRDSLTALARKINAPVSTTLMGTGSFPIEDKLYTGMIGMHGTKASNMGATHSDLIIAIGARFSDRVSSDRSRFAEKAKIIHIDIDPAEISKNIMADHSLLGDARLIMDALTKIVEPREGGLWVKEIGSWKEEFPHMDKEDMTALNPQFIMRKLYEITQGNAIITTDVGQHQIWTAQFYTSNNPRTFLTSGGLGTMGYGVGAGIGAQVGKPDTRVITISGDGCFRMNCNELATIEYYNLPNIIIVMNNRTLGMVRQWQKLFYCQRYSSTTLDRGPDFKKLAEAYGIDGYQVFTKGEFVEAINAAWANNVPAVIDCHINQDELVLPMVAPGKPIENIISGID